MNARGTNRNKRNEPRRRQKPDESASQHRGTLELDLRRITVHNASMAGRILTYLLSVLLPISPMLCGQCNGSVRCQSADSECCRALTAADSLPPPPKCCQAKCPNSEKSLSQSTAPPHLVFKSSTPAEPQPPRTPCRHEHCRSAICGQSAVTLRRNDWSVQDAQEQILFLLREWSLLAPLREPDHGIDCSFSSNRHWEVNAGPGGRAARIAFCSWLI
jgi:hypothetical protein